MSAKAIKASHHMNRDRPTGLATDTSETCLLPTQLVQTVHIGHGVLLEHRNRVVVLEAALICLLHEWHQRMVTTGVEHLACIQSSDIGLSTINRLDTFIGVESLLASQIVKVILKESTIPFQGLGEVLAFVLLFNVRGTPGQLMNRMLIKRRIVKLGCRKRSNCGSMSKSTDYNNNTATSSQPHPYVLFSKYQGLVAIYTSFHCILVENGYVATILSI